MLTGYPIYKVPTATKVLSSPTLRALLKRLCRGSELINASDCLGHRIATSPAITHVVIGPDLLPHIHLKNNIQPNSYLLLVISVTFLNN
jgi:hypothetical protein